MDILVTLKGPQVGNHYNLDPENTIIGRHPESQIYLESQAVSRHHARIRCQDGVYFVEDLRSSNGTYLNGKRITHPLPLAEQDQLQIGPYLFALRKVLSSGTLEDSMVIREVIDADPSTHSFQGQDSAYKLKVVLEIAQHLGRTLDVEVLLNKLLDQLMQLFPHSDRAMVLLHNGEQLVVRSQRCRGGEDPTKYSYSRTIVKKALEDGVGILSEDARADKRFQSSTTLIALELRSLLCVPLICQGGRRLGVLQLDRFRTGRAFQMEDLQMLTVVGIQVAVVLENAALHTELLREERLHQELALAREIQQGFLPSEFPQPDKVGYELFARLEPAQEVAGDLYDFFRLEDNRLAFFVGDVSGKGMPAALFMVAVRTLGRHLASGGQSPAQTLRDINAALGADNPSGMFVTLFHGIYQPATGEIVMASGGHPMPFLRRSNGHVEVLSLATGRLLGYEGGDLKLSDTRLVLAHGETIIIYTDGFSEAKNLHLKTMFGDERLRATLEKLRPDLSLEAYADDARAAVKQFTGEKELQDDMTLLLLRRQ